MTRGPAPCGHDARGSTLVSVLVVLMALGVLAAAAFRASKGSKRGDVLGSGERSAQAACATDAAAVEMAVDAFRARMDADPRELADLVPDYLRSPPDTARYTIGVGTSAAPGTMEPTMPATGPAGAPSDWPSGRVLVAPGPPPVGATSYRQFRASVGAPCVDPAIR